MRTYLLTFGLLLFTFLASIYGNTINTSVRCNGRSCTISCIARLNQTSFTIKQQDGFSFSQQNFTFGSMNGTQHRFRNGIDFSCIWGYCCYFDDRDNNVKVNFEKINGVYLIRDNWVRVASDPSLEAFQSFILSSAAQSTINRSLLLVTVLLMAMFHLL